MDNIDPEKDVYLFLHGRMDLMPKVAEAMTQKGFLKEKIVHADPKKVGKIGDYMAMLWRPPTPDQIKIQKITQIEEVEPEGMVGLWKGVQKEDLFTIPLN